MSGARATDYLSTIDALFLYLEKPGAPLNVASISNFEGLITLDECRKHIASKMHLMPRFAQRVVHPPLGIGIPMWQFDPHFDIRNHVREITLEHGTEAEWKAAASRLLSSHLDRDRPLWDVTLFHGLKNNRTGIVVRTHHCLVDGVAGVGMLRSLLDSSPTPEPIPTQKSHFEPPPPPSLATVLLDGILRTCLTAAKSVLTAESELVRMAEQVAAPGPKKQGTEQPAEVDLKMLGGIAPLSDLACNLVELARPVQRLPFNTLCKGPQKFEWIHVSMEEITAVKQACAGTVNDVVLTTMTAMLRRYAEHHRWPVRGRTLRLVAPVNLRGVTETSDMGNHITFLPVDIPFGVREPNKLFASVKEKVASSRGAYAAELVGLVTTLLGTVPAPFQSLIGTVLSQLPLSLCNSICTNVHGPRTPLYLRGHRMLASYPYVPIGGEMGMNCAVLSYDGTLFVGFTGDARAIPDLELLPLFFQESFAELKKAVGIDTPKPKAPRVKRKVARQRKAEPAHRISEVAPETTAAALAAARQAEEASLQRESA
ncbi:MAG: hypothetical protein CXZ00_08260 [Acidobacteria bacterium]|nr:MAG: hypothetical protein CXZ00_08260 [Acidobacteriota bacterium]